MVHLFNLFMYTYVHSVCARGPGAVDLFHVYAGPAWVYAGPSDFGAGQLAGQAGNAGREDSRGTRIILGRLGMEKSVEKLT